MSRPSFADEKCGGPITGHFLNVLEETSDAQPAFHLHPVHLALGGTLPIPLPAPSLMGTRQSSPSKLRCLRQIARSIGYTKFQQVDSQGGAEWCAHLDESANMNIFCRQPKSSELSSQPLPCGNVSFSLRNADIAIASVKTQERHVLAVAPLVSAQHASQPSTSQSVWLLLVDGPVQALLAQQDLFAGRVGDPEDAISLSNESSIMSPQRSEASRGDAAPFGNIDDHVPSHEEGAHNTPNLPTNGKYDAAPSPIRHRGVGSSKAWKAWKSFNGILPNASGSANPKAKAHDAIPSVDRGPMRFPTPQAPQAPRKVKTMRDLENQVVENMFARGRSCKHPENKGATYTSSESSHSHPVPPGVTARSFDALESLQFRFEQNTANSCNPGGNSGSHGLSQDTRCQGKSGATRTKLEALLQTARAKKLRELCSKSGASVQDGVSETSGSEGTDRSTEKSTEGDASTTSLEDGRSGGSFKSGGSSSSSSAVIQRGSNVSQAVRDGSLAVRAGAQYEF